MKKEYKIDCESCEDQLVCQYYNRAPPEGECPDYSIALALFEQLPEKEIKDFEYSSLTHKEIRAKEKEWLKYLNEKRQSC